MDQQNIDHLVLGCTHYPYLIPILKKMLPDSVKIIDSGAAVAKHTKTVLTNNYLLNTGSKTGKHELYTNSNIDALRSLIPPQNKLTTKIATLDF